MRLEHHRFGDDDHHHSIKKLNQDEPSLARAAHSMILYSFGFGTTRAEGEEPEP